jgi:transcriptional regulator with XRE-family HTH domain
MRARSERERCAVFGAAVRRLRLKQHLSQRRLSCLAGMERSHLSRIERGFGDSGPRLNTIGKLLRALGIGSVILRVPVERSRSD